MDYTDVKERVNELEGAIKRLDSVRKHLSRNASDIKTEIHASVSRNLECLRGREVSLLGAVDQVLAVKEDTLQGQQARLNQALGVLTTSLSMAGGVVDTDRQQLTDALDRLNKVELSPEETPYISFRADHLGLREAILSYGRVDANGLPLATAFEDPSKPSASLPRHLEEYEDWDHHVFYKTVGQAQAGVNPSTSITVAIPKLSTRVEDWLQKKVPRPAEECTARAARPSSLPHRIRSETALTGSSTPGSSCSLNNWLSLIKQHADLEEEHDFEITDNTARQNVKPGTSTPSSAGMTQNLPHAQRDPRLWLQGLAEGKSSCYSDLFKHIPSDPKVWLAQAYSQLRELSVSSGKDKPGEMFGHISKESASWLQAGTPNKNSKVTSTLKPAPLKETSNSNNSSRTSGSGRLNLFSHISSRKDDWLLNESKTSTAAPRWETNRDSTLISVSTDTSDWLPKDEPNSEASKPNQPRVPVVELEDVCRANELCCSMSECVSKPDCVAMFLCTEEASADPESSATKDKNQKTVAPFNFQPWSMVLEDWLSPADSTFGTPSKDPAQGQLEKLSLGMQNVEKMEAKETEADSCDIFHMIPSLSDPMWQAPTNEKGAKEEENLWLHKSPALSHTDALFNEWLALAKGDDSEGWSVVSDSFSVQSDQQAMDVATADHFINKWLL